MLAALDRLRRAFLWAAADKISGAKCLVSWDQVCRPKEEGGLGVRSIPTQNSCLLIKLLYRLHCATNESWPRWVWRAQAGLPLEIDGADSALLGAHWSSLRRLLPLYRSISRVKIGDGVRTAFWLDWWLPSGPVAAAMPELFSHCSLQCASVRQILTHGLDAVLAPRLSAVAAEQRERLLLLLSTVQLSHNVDERTLPLCGKAGGKLSTSALYKLCSFGGVLDERHDFVWNSYAPSKVKFFGWLAVKDRIQSRNNLLRKKILTADESSCPICSAALETGSHILFGCSFARQFWSSIGSQPEEHRLIFDAATCSLPSSAPPGSASTLRLLCPWHLWKHRNDVVFNGLAPSIELVRKRCRDDAVLWRSRLPMSKRADVDVWLVFFLPRRWHAAA